MKIIVAVFILVIFAFAFAACGKIETFTNLTQQKIETEKTADEQPDEPPILEITQDAEGMYEVTGKTLVLNLYENGVIEFEVLDDKKRSAALAKNPKQTIGLKAEELNSLKRAKISRVELQNFLDLLKSEDFKNAKNDYRRKCCCTDASMDIGISLNDAGRQKNIDLQNYCDWGELKTPAKPQGSDFPKVLSDLLVLTEKVRVEYFSDKSSN